jgi:putative DNA primase/helicase
MDLRPLKSRLADRAEALVVGLLGEPTRKRRREWRWGRRGSLSYDFQRHLWRSFETEEGGDALDLIRFANPGWDLRQALDWARAWVGDGVGDRVGDRPTAAARPAPRRHPRREAARTADLALGVWREARPAAGTIVETYLERRGLRLPEHSDEVLRFHPACPRGADRLPAMLGLMRDIAGDRPAGVHRTFLSADGHAKAAVEPNKMMLGAARGAVLKLTPDEDVTSGLAITEGIEDGLAVLNDGWAPVWVCLSAGTMMRFPVLGGVEALSIFCDNDAPGANAAEGCVARWQEAGREACVVEPPHHHKDFAAKAEAERHD